MYPIKCDCLEPQNHDYTNLGLWICRCGSKPINIDDYLDEIAEKEESENGK